jgi:biopolymer transport protein ExbB
MERFLNALGTIASAGPLLGLLGTVVGMIQMFLGILDHGVGDVNQLAGGIGKALVCTATGMIVAIPALMFHRYFKGRINGYVIEMEQEASALLDALDGRPGVMAGAVRPVAPAAAGDRTAAAKA